MGACWCPCCGTANTHCTVACCGMALIDEERVTSVQSLILVGSNPALSIASTKKVLDEGLECRDFACSLSSPRLKERSKEYSHLVGVNWQGWADVKF